MNRVLFIVLMLLLPLQWSWASAASVCAHEKAKSGHATHFGHHEHAHQGAGHADDQGDAKQAGSLAAHADCGVCHGLHSAFVPAFDGAAKPWAARTFFTPYASAVPGRVVDTLLRPPLALVS